MSHSDSCPRFPPMQEDWFSVRGAAQTGAESLKKGGTRDVQGGRKGRRGCAGSLPNGQRCRRWRCCFLLERRDPRGTAVSGRVLERAGRQYAPNDGQTTLSEALYWEFREQVAKVLQVSERRSGETVRVFGTSTDSVLRRVKQAHLDAGRSQNHHGATVAPLSSRSGHGPPLNNSGVPAAPWRLAAASDVTAG